MNSPNELPAEIEDTPNLRKLASPLDVDGVDLDLSTGEILRYVAEGRRSAPPMIAKAAVGMPIPALPPEEMRALEVLEDVSRYDKVTATGLE